MMTSVPELFDIHEPYWLFCREERNLAAIFYHLLLCGDNLERFCRAVDYQPRLSDPAVYFEYARLRDLWSCLGQPSGQGPASANARKRKLILELLRPSMADYLAFCSVEEFNQYFGAVSKPSSSFIQSPGTWSLIRFRRNIADSDEFLRTCLFKWSFNAKPDIVIHADLDHALCIEAKLESKEGTYPSSPAEKTIFNKLGLQRVTQTELQRYLMEDLLGAETEFLMLVEDVGKQSTQHRMLTWRAAFAALDLGRQPSMVNAWIKKVERLG